MNSRKSTAEALRAFPLFQSLDERGLEEIADLLIERKFPKDAVICEEGVAGDYMYLIQQGLVKVTKTSDDGREKILEIFGEGAFIGEMALFEREPRSASMKTTAPCVLLALSRQDFLALLRQSSEIAMGVIRELSRRLRDTDDQVRALMFERVEQRTRRVLRRLARDPHASRPDLRLTGPVTHQQLADLVGTSRETVTRAVKALKDEGWLEQQGKRYAVRVEDQA